MRRTQRLPAEPVQIDYFGGLKPAGVIGAGDFKAHDASTTWEDNGRSRELAEALTSVVEQLTASLHTYGAEQARDAVLDYVSGAYADMALIEGRASLVVDASNEAAQFRVHWSLEELLNKVVQDALDRESYEIVDEIHRVCERTALMLNAMTQDAAPPPEPPRMAPRAAPAKIPAPRLPTPRNGAVPTVRRVPTTGR